MAKIITPGDKIGRITVIVQVPDHGKQKYWKVQCECGNVMECQHYYLVSAREKSTSISCGKGMCGNAAKHGHSHTAPEYLVWCAMRNRCYLPKTKSYRDYGGRGIRVCERWQGSDGYANFIQDMGRRPSSKHMIERKNNEGDYTPDNCVWSTRLEQANNRRNNRCLEFKGQTHTLAEWGRIVGIHPTTLWKRINRGWSVVDTLTVLEDCSPLTRFPQGGHGNPGSVVHSSH